MAINKKIINFKKAEDFTKEYEAGNILEKSLVFIDDTHQIVTHNTVFDGNIPNWKAEEGEAGYIKNKPDLSNIGGKSISPYPKNNQFIYFSTDGQKIDLTTDSRWQETVETIVSNEYDGCGVITFKEDITTLPAISRIFKDYSKIVELVLPNCITAFSNYQFSSMSNLFKVNIPTSLSTLPQGCFNYCSNLYEIRLPSNIKEIPQNCFSGCSNLTFINLNNVEIINGYAFQYCSSLTSVNLSKLKTFNGVSQFQCCASLTELILADENGVSNLTEIPNGCFAYHNLKHIEIPSKITSIGYNAFNSTKKIDTVTIRPNIVFDMSSIIGGNWESIKFYMNYSMLEQYRNKYPYYYGCFYCIGYDYYTGVYQNQLWTGTQDEYDAITNKDSNTFYFIKED